ncbi:MAG: PASTA domain-containing protein [Clostridiales bacterium]|jgi:stage V sporulation protein D (sporulation-specific penicillin-binding protein)|nr:PASTA domain-containing protein [Clostridiales bacterium]
MAYREKEKVTTKAPTRQMWRRSVIVLVLMLLFCISILGKLSLIQIVEADYWREKAVGQQMSDSTISPKRGTIYDSKMMVLAQSATVWTVIMSPYNIKQESTRNKIADELSKLLDVDREKLYKKTLKTNSQYEVVKAKIEYPLAKTLSQWIDDNKLGTVFRIIEDYKRYYPMNNLASAILGFTGTDNNGLYGLEAYYEKTLAGKPGRIVTAKNGWGDDLDIKLRFEKTIGAQDGNSLMLTIDSTVQYYAEKYLEIAVKENMTSNRGAVIIMDVNTGAIIAMATKGDFDPNEPMVIVDPGEQEKLALLAGDEKSAAVKKALEKQWTNKPISDYYDPGSVYKTFTLAAALEEGVVTENSHFYCKGGLQVGDRFIKCHKYPLSHGSQNLAQAISNSCNPAFIEIGQKLGGSLFFKYFTGFGFNGRTGVDMLGESKVTESLYFSEKNLENVINLSVASFGQNFKVTPIQIITAMSAIANGGKLMQPYVVQQILDSNGNVISNTEPIVKRQVISKETSKKISTMLENSVRNGGGKNAYIPGYRMAGKTGTSEKTDQNIKNKTNDVVASFAGYAPADDPKYAILVLLDEPQVSIRYGGTISAPVGQRIMAEALPYLGVEPKYTDEEKAAMDRTTPNVTGKKVSVAQTMLKNSDLKYQVVGSGETVIKQVPAKGESIPRYGTVVLYTEEGTLSQTTTVPDFKGMTMNQANIAAANHKINIQMNGLGMSSSEAKASTQSIEAGKKVPLGTVVKVNFVYEDRIE